MKKSIEKIKNSKKKPGPKAHIQAMVPKKNCKTVIHNMKLTAKMCDLAFTSFCFVKLNQRSTFTNTNPRMSDVIISAKLAGVWPSTFLNKKLRIKLIPA